MAIARALAKNPKLLLCDEPTGALDYLTGKNILSLLHSTCRRMGMTVVVITHNQAITQMADRVISVKNGRVVDMSEMCIRDRNMAAAAVLEAVFALGARPAQPGEFIKRAFINGKISLAQAESVGELIDARTAQAARMAARGLGGELDGRLKAFQEEVADLLAGIEAAFDYPEQLEEEPAREALNASLDALIPSLENLRAVSYTHLRRR